MGFLYLIGFKYTFWKIFHTLNKVLAVETSTQGFLENQNLKITFGPKYFCKKILYCSIHMTWSLGKGFGSRRWSIRVGWFIWFLEHLQTANRKPIKHSPNHSKVFVKPHFSMIISLSVVAWKSGCDRPSPLQESRPGDSQTRCGKEYENLDMG